MVADGSLPSVEDRLPAEPYVIQPFESIGSYERNPQSHQVFRWPRLGRRILHAPGDDARAPRVRKWISRSSPTSGQRLGVQSRRQDPHHLPARSGTSGRMARPSPRRTSCSGHEDLTLNEEYTPLISRRWYVNDELMEMRTVDETTVQFDFAGPWRGMIYHLSDGASGITNRSPYAQSEYLKQFHPDYSQQGQGPGQGGGLRHLVPAPAGEGPIQR